MRKTVKFLVSIDWLEILKLTCWMITYFRHNEWYSLWRSIIKFNHVCHKATDYFDRVNNKCETNLLTITLNQVLYIYVGNHMSYKWMYITCDPLLLKNHYFLWLISMIWNGTKEIGKVRVSMWERLRVCIYERAIGCVWVMRVGEVEMECVRVCRRYKERQKGNEREELNSKFWKFML